MADGKVEGKDLKVVCRRTDLPKNQRRPVQDAVRLLYHRCVKKDEANTKRSKAARWGEFADSLKASLDKNLGPHWHVLVGTQLGFACKKRDNTMGVWHVDNAMVVIWQSPGLEGPPSSGAENAPTADTEGATAEPDAAEAEPAAKRPAGLGTVKVLEPKSVEEGSEVAQTIAAIKKEVAETSSNDVQVIAQSLRRRLMEELGPIWHVVVGTDFAIETAENRQNFVLSTAGKFRIVCFQHEQLREKRIDFERIIKASPYLLVTFFCFAYMTLMNLCQEGVKVGPRAAWIQQRYCHEGWESDLSTIGAVALGIMFFVKKSGLFVPKIPAQK